MAKDVYLASFIENTDFWVLQNQLTQTTWGDQPEDWYFVNALHLT